MSVLARQNINIKSKLSYDIFKCFGFYLATIKTRIKQGNIQMFEEKMLIVYSTGHRKMSSLTAETRVRNFQLLGLRRPVRVSKMTIKTCHRPFLHIHVYSTESQEISSAFSWLLNWKYTFNMEQKMVTTRNQI